MKQFEISKIKTKLSFKTQDSTLPYISKIIDYGYDIDFDVFLETKGCNLQRPLCWNLNQKQELIFSILKGIEIPQLSILLREYEDGKKTLKVIDGKQRLNAIISFYKNEFPILFNGEEYYFSELGSSQSLIRLLMLKVKMAYDYFDDKLPDEELIKWFNLINFSGTEQDKKHIDFLNSLI